MGFSDPIRTCRLTATASVLALVTGSSAGTLGGDASAQTLVKFGFDFKSEGTPAPFVAGLGDASFPPPAADRKAI